MKNYFIKLVSLFTFTLLNFVCFSQTIIDYSNWTTASGCNIFSVPNNASTVVNVPCTINGANANIAHLTAVGQPTYDNTNQTVNLISETRNNGSENRGTEYRITVNFKQGYSYKITIIAERIMQQQIGANVNLRTDLNNGGSSSNNLCNGTDIINASTSGDLKKSVAVTNSDFTNINAATYVFDYPSLSSNESYLMIAAIPPANSVNQTILIKQIKIEETAPAASFSISSSISSMVCGTTNPVTFTINNSNNTTGITGYTWNVGTVPNGWLYNGIAAPATIPVTSATLSTLSLTPDCGKALSNVSATVTANGSNYNTTNSSSISITQPSFAISGSSSLCSGSGTYSITGMPCNASVAWAVPPSNMANLSSLTTSPTTMTYAGTSGSFTLSANVTSCNVTTPVTLPVHVGPYTSSNYSLSVNGVTGSNPLYWCPNQNYTFSVLGGSGSNYNWSVPSGWSILYNAGTPLALRSPSGTTPATGTVSVSFTEPCGTTVTLNKTVIYSNGCSGNSIYSVSPNPASTNITIACISLQTYCNIAAVQITDINGTVMSSQSWSYTNQQVQMPVYFLQNGTYIARIYSGTQWYSVTFFVQH